MERRRRVSRRRLAPELVDQPVARDHLSGVQQQHGQQRPLLGAAEAQRDVAPQNLQGPQNPELKPRAQAPTLPGRQLRETAISPRCQPDVSPARAMPARSARMERLAFTAGP